MPRVVVIGAGNAGMCAALSARQSGADVTILEAAPKNRYGSDSHFSGGLFRVAYDRLADLETIVGPMNLKGASGLDDFQAYTEGDFLSDWGRVTGYRCDPVLSDLIVSRSQEDLRWLRGLGVSFGSPIVVDEHGRARHSRPGWHGGFAEASGAGPGLTESLMGACRKAGIDTVFGANARSLERREDTSTWRVTAAQDAREVQFDADRAVIASGGFQADPEWRTRCLGPGWDLARVRGSGYNTGQGLKMAFAVGAAAYGNWSGAHAVAWSVGSGEAGRLDANHIFERESYPFGITVNVNGERFIDEGSDFGAYTYARYGREVLRQPEQAGWQLFDAQSFDLFTSEYRVKNPEAARTVGDTLDELITRLADRGVNGAALKDTVERFNAAVSGSAEFSPYIKDGRHTERLAINKSNWARALVRGPFHAYEVTCGITFTFGGLRVNGEAAVLDAGGDPIPGLYSCGESVGGLHYFNYGSGTGLTSGTVLGRIAGRQAAS